MLFAARTHGRTFSVCASLDPSRLSGIPITFVEKHDKVGMPVQANPARIFRNLFAIQTALVGRVISPRPSPPPRGRGCPEGRVRGWIMVPMHAEKRKGASHEPSPRSGVSAERRWLVVATNCGALPRRRYARVHGPNACAKAKGGFP